MTDLIKDRKLGKIEVSDFNIRIRAGPLFDFIKNGKIVEAERDLNRFSVYYILYHKAFRSLKEDEKIPLYHIKAEYESETKYSICVEEVEN